MADPTKPAYLPTPEEIAERALEIRLNRPSPNSDLPEIEARVNADPSVYHDAMAASNRKLAIIRRENGIE